MSNPRNELWYVGWVVGLLILLALYTNFVQAFSEVPPQDMTCAEAPFANNNFVYIKCEFPPHISKFVTPEANTPQRGALLIPRFPTKKLKLRAHFGGYSASPEACDDWGFSDPNYIVTKNCPDHLGDTALLGGGVGTWGGPMKGENPYGWRIAALLKYAYDHYGTLIDYGAGVELEGCSYGGTTAILQSLIMPDPWAKALITVVNACVPQTLMVRQDAPVGQYWRSAQVQASWGAYDWRLADPATQTTGRVYYRLNGSPADTSVVFDTDFFRKVCDDNQNACAGTWHSAGHNIAEPGVNLPFQQLYSGPDMQARLDRPLVIFTHSTANYWGIRGHYNLGMEWNTAGITNSNASVKVPVRYRAHSSMGGGIPDQPDTATVDLTLRRTKLTDGTYHYTLGQQSGLATATAGVITITGLTLESSETYTELRIER